jgi:hypothetical protein
VGGKGFLRIFINIFDFMESLWIRNLKILLMLIVKQYNYQFENFYATVIQQAYRNYKKRPKSLAKQVWEVVRNDVIPNEKKFLGIVPRKIKIPNYNDWIMKKKCQLWE